MSKKSAFPFWKKTKVTPKQAPEPRQLEEINKQYASLCAEAGQLQYKILINQEQLRDVNTMLRNVNNEAAERNKLNAEAKAAETKPEAEAASVNA